jgi:hypothetical protein
MCQIYFGSILVRDIGRPSAYIYKNTEKLIQITNFMPSFALYPRLRDMLFRGSCSQATAKQLRVVLQPEDLRAARLIAFRPYLFCAPSTQAVFLDVHTSASQKVESEWCVVFISAPFSLFHFVISCCSKR